MVVPRCLGVRECILCPLCSWRLPSQQSLVVFLRPNQPLFTGVVAGTDGLTRRWNCGGGRVARLGRSLDFPYERFSAGQVVCGAGNAELPDKLETGR